MTHDGKTLLKGAYALDTPESNKRYYQDFAASYDSAFVEDLGYVYPKALAQVYQRLKLPPDTLIADIGCGTGAVAAAMQAPNIDGFDISADMLAVAKSKNLYRNTHELDLTKPLPKGLPKYDAILSAGTFTHGHLGPDALENLLNLANKGAYFCIGINAEHFDSHGFGQRLDDLKSKSVIGPITHNEVPIYARDNHDHAQDMAFIVTFQRG